MEPARGAKALTGTATILAFVGIVTGLQTAAAAEDAAQARRQLTSELAAHDGRLAAQTHAKEAAQVRIARERAAKKAAAKRMAAAKKVAAESRNHASVPAVGYRAPVTTAPRAAAPQAAPRPAPRAAAPKPPPPVDATSGGSGG